MSQNQSGMTKDEIRFLGILQEVQDWVNSLPIEPSDMLYTYAQNYVRSVTLNDTIDQESYMDYLRRQLGSVTQDAEEVNAKIKELESIKLNVEYVKLGEQF